MAIGAFDNAVYQMQQMQAQQAALDGLRRQNSVGPTLTPESGAAPGSLIIADFYETTPGNTLSHGEMVNTSARQNGFQGPVRTLAQPLNFVRNQEQQTAKGVLFNPNSTPEQARSAVSNYSRSQALSVLESQTNVVNTATQSGAKNSALNISMGGSVAQSTNDLYMLASGAWDPKETQEVRDGCLPFAKNLASAYGVDLSKLTSSDKKVAGPERAKLQSALANGISSSLGSDSEVGQAKRAFATSVGRFEANKNSVVISSGNEGDYQEQMQKDAHGVAAKGMPKDFETNHLDTPEATMVGATRWFNSKGGPQERIAAYSNVNSGVDIYATGSLDLKKDGKGADTFGTSFSAPKVASMMASLHKANPQMSSAQVEHLMKTKFTHQLQGDSGNVSVLDYSLSSDFMVGRKSPQ